MPASSPVAHPPSLAPISRFRLLALAFCAGLAHAALLGLAFPPFQFAYLALLALVPPALLVRWLSLRRAALPRGRRWRVLTALVFGLATLPFWLYQQQFIAEITAAGYVPLCIHLALWPSVWLLLAWVIAARLPRLPLPLVIALTWTAVELFRGRILWNGYAWFFVSQPLIDTPFALAARSVGQFGVSFLMAWLAAGAVSAWLGPRRLPPRRRALAALLRVGALLLPLLVTACAAVPGLTTYAQRGHLRVAVVQTNLPQSNKLGWSAAERARDFADFLAATRAAARTDPDLIVWPETMFPGSFLQTITVPTAAGSRAAFPSRFADELLALQRELNIPILVGAIGADHLRLENDGQHLAWDNRYNSVFLIQNGAVDPGRYDKIRLTPFGEVMPYISAWPWLERQLLAIGASGMSFDLAAGSRIHVFTITPRHRSTHNAPPKPVRIVTPICFEVTWPDLIRAMVDQGQADVVINLTNDGWFMNHDPGRVEHLQVARWRSLELAKPTIRAANTGISAFIDPSGQVAEQGPVRAAAVVSGSVPILNGRAAPLDESPGAPRFTYSLVGDWPAWLSLLASTVLASAALFRGRPRPIADSPPASALRD